MKATRNTRSATKNGKPEEAPVPTTVGLSEPLVANLHTYITSRPWAEVSKLAEAFDAELRAILAERKEEPA